MLVAVIIPVLGRPERVAPLVRSVRTDDRCWPMFMCSPGDDAEIAEVRRHAEQGPALMHVVEWEAGQGDYARKINAAFRVAVEKGYDWCLLAADDVVFHPGWLDACLRVHAATEACVVGTNDLGNSLVMQGRHATHSLVHRDYLECGTIDEDGKILHEGYHHNFCNTENAPIWMADLTFKELGDVEVGDEVMGWQRTGENVGGLHPGHVPLKKLCPSTVLAAARRRAEIVRVRFESGRTLDCTPDHLWFNGVFHPSSRTSKEWVTVAVDRQLLHVVSQPPRLHPELEHLAGWVAGIYDGEGSGVYVATQCSDKNPEVYAAIAAALKRLNIPYSLPESGRTVGYFNLTGGRQGYLDFLLRVRPVKRERLAAKIIGTARFGLRDRIVAVERAPNGEGWVRSMTTTTGNYVAWGYCSKNCDVEMVETAKDRGTFAPALDSIVEHQHHLWGKGADDATYARGRARYRDDQALLMRRRRLWT